MRDYYAVSSYGKKAQREALARSEKEKSLIIIDAYALMLRSYANDDNVPNVRGRALWCLASCGRATAQELAARSRHIFGKHCTDKPGQMQGGMAICELFGLVYKPVRGVFAWSGTRTPEFFGVKGSKYLAMQRILE